MTESEHQKLRALCTHWTDYIHAVAEIDAMVRVDAQTADRQSSSRSPQNQGSVGQ